MKITIEISEYSIIEFLTAMFPRLKIDDTKSPQSSPTQKCDLRGTFKKLAKEKGYTYAQMAAIAGIEESTIKCFMCGANDSRRIAEKLADVLGISILYKDGEFIAVEKTEGAGDSV